MADIQRMPVSGKAAPRCAIVARSPGSCDTGVLEHRLSAAVLGAGTFESALAEVARAAGEACSWAAVQIWTRRMSGAGLECSPAWYSTSDSHALLRKLTLAAGKPEEWLAELVDRGSAFTLALGRDSESPRFRAAADAGLASVLSVPLDVQKSVVAAVELYSTGRLSLESPCVRLVIHALSRVALVLERLRLDDSLGLLQEAMESATDAIAISTLEPVPSVRYVNRALIRLLGRQRRDLLGRPCGEVFSGIMSEEVRSAAEARVHAGLPFSSDLVLQSPGGASRHVELTVSHFSRQSGSSPHVITMFRDVTERRQRELEREQLRVSVINSARQWRQTFDAIDSPAVIVDRNGIVRRLNRRAAEMARRPYSRVIGTMMTTSLGTEEPWPTADALLQHVASIGEGASDQAVDGASGSSWNVTVTPLGAFSDPSGMAEERYLVLAQDIQHIVELQESVQRHERMAVMGEIVAGVAHEVRNPLFGMSATLDAFESRFGTDPQHQPYLAVLRSTVERMASLMRDLLDYGRPPMPALGLEPFLPVLAAAREDCAGLAAARGVAIEEAVSDAAVALNMDSARLRRAMLNVLENAIQHAPPGSIVNVRCHPSECGTWLRCSVRDRGPGFHVEDLPHLFVPFYTKRPGGTGLGLAIVQRIIEQHGGHVTAANHPDGGALVTLQLPVQRGAES